MNLAQADRIATALVGELDDACVRIAVAGSIRRRKPEVKDIELVAIPRWAERAVSGQASLFEANVEPLNLLQQRINALAPRVQPIKSGTQQVEPWHLTPTGKYWRLWLPLVQLKVDLFVCSPETWGLNFMIRTGSGVGPSGAPADGFAPAMLARWKQVSGGGMAYEAQLRGANGGTHPTPEEQNVFAACRVQWVPPEQRLSSRDVERNLLP